MAGGDELEELAATAVFVAGRAWHDTGLVFTSEIGTPLDPSNLRDEFEKVTRWAKLGR